MIKDMADLFAVEGQGARQILEELRGEAKDALALSISEAPPSSNALGQYRYFKAEQLPLLMRLEDPAERRAALEDIAIAQSLKLNNLQKALAAAEKEAREAAAKGSENEEPSEEEEGFAPEPNTQAATLVRYAEDAELFRTPDGEAYVTFPVAGHRETHAVRSKAVRLWLQRRFYEDHGRPPGAQALQDALGVLEAKAFFEGEEHPVHVRVAEHEGAIYVDLANEAWEVVKITPAGFEIVCDPPVRFRRRKGMLALPHPVIGGSVGALRRFVNLKDAKDWLLLLAWLVQAFRPTSRYPILILQGEQGSAKTTLARMLKATVDPSTTPVRSVPRGEHDLVIAANNSWVMALDNLSGLPHWLSDALCRLSTGGGFSTRTLYENDEETLFDATRPVILNGITDVATRADLLDRAIILV